MSTFLLRRPVDWSLLTNGFHIPTEFHPLVYAMPGGELHPGAKRGVKIMIDGEVLDARMNNIGFDQQRYPGHPDLLQIRYSPGSLIARKLQSMFTDEFECLKLARENAAPRTQVQLPEEYSSEIVFYATMQANTFIIECNHTADKQVDRQELQQMSELDFETFTPRFDPNAGIKEKTAIQRIRQLDRSIGDSLKQLYGYRCQMTGELGGEPYGVTCVEAHHIIPFTESMNNDTSNIIILSPSYHRIIHKAKPVFDRPSLSFHFPNGLVERVKIDKHLANG